MDQILQESGIKKKPCWLQALYFILFALVGFCLGVIAINSGAHKLGGALIVVTSLATFFVVVGYSVIQGDQIQRFDKFILKNRSLINADLSAVNLRFIASFSRCKEVVNN
jgi:hypothetical protein